MPCLQGCWLPSVSPSWTGPSGPQGAAVEGRVDQIDAYATVTAVLPTGAIGRPNLRDAVVETVQILRTTRRHQTLNPQIQVAMRTRPS